MNTRLKQSLRTSLEQVVITDPTQITDPVANDVNLALSDTDYARRYAEDAAADAEVVDDVVETLEAIAASLESAVQGSGLSAREGYFANLAIEQQLNRVGVTSDVLSTESFGGTKTRLVATQESLDNVKEKLKQMWEALKVMVKRAWEAIISFFNSLFRSATLLRETAKATAVKARALDMHAKPRKGYVALSPRLAGTLALGNTVGWDMANSFDKLRIRLGNDTEALTDQLHANFKALTNYVETGDDKQLDEIVRSMKTVLNRNGLQRKDHEQGLLFYSNPLPGNVRLEMYYPLFEEITDSEDATKNTKLKAVSDMLRGQKVTLAPVEFKGDLVLGAETLAPGQIALLADSVAHVAQWSIDFDRRLKQLSKEADDAMREAGAKIFSVNGGALGESKASIHAGIAPKEHAVVFRAFGQAATFMVRPAMVMQHYTISIARAALVVAQKSHAEYQYKEVPAGVDKKETAAVAPIDEAVMQKQFAQGQALILR